MFTRPVGVQELLGSPATPSPVLCGAWKYFCMKSKADALCSSINATFGLSLSVVEDGEESALYVFQSSDVNLTPRIWSIVGVDQNNNTIGESAGWILDRRGGFDANGTWRCAPAWGIDKGGPYAQADTVSMGFNTMYGIAEFFWSK